MHSVIERVTNSRVLSYAPVFPVLVQSQFRMLSGKWLGSRQIRCNWATKGAGGIEEKQNSDAKSVVELTNASSGQYNVFHETMIEMVEFKYFIFSFYNS